MWGDQWCLKMTQDILKRECYRSLSHHALFPAILASEFLACLTDRDICQEVDIVEKVENRTRFHLRRGSGFGVAEGSYASLSARMSGTASLMAGLERVAQVFHKALDLNQSHENHCPAREVNQEGNGYVYDMQSCVIRLRDRLLMQEVQIKFLNRRAEIQLTAVSNHLQ